MALGGYLFNMQNSFNPFGINSNMFFQQGCDYSLGAQLGLTLSNLGTGILGAYLNGSLNKSSNESGSQSAAATVEQIETEIRAQETKSTKCDDYINNPEKYVDDSLLTKASKEFQNANTNLNSANTALSTADKNFKTAEAAYKKLTDTDRSKPENSTVVDTYNKAKKALDDAKKQQQTAQKAYNQAKENEMKQNNAYATNLKAVKEKAERSKASIEADIAKLETKLEKAKNAALVEAGKEAKGNSRYLSKSEYAGLFDTNGNLIKSPDTDYKAAANKAASAFLKTKTPEDAKKFLKLYDQLTADEKKSFSGLVKDKADEIAKAEA